MGPSFSIRRTITNLPIPWKLSLIIGLFSIVVFVLLALSYTGMEVLSGSRAYVGGEGLWSKAEKGAIYRLTRYALFHEEADYQKYLEHISIPLGDHEARLELAKPAMDDARVAHGFIQGRNDPADVKIMIFMARRLHSFRYMNRALQIWGEADQEIGELPAVARALHQEIASGHPSPLRVKALLDEVHTIDARLTPMEDEFSYTLGQGARWLKAVLLVAMVLATCLFLAVTLAIAFLISKHLCDEIDQLRKGAARIAGGDYSLSLNVESKDEVGDLARTFAQMAAQRHEAERLKDEFFANVSHELRTPLTLILSPLESLVANDYGAMDSTLRPALQIMHNNTVRLLQLVNGLLDFAKLEAGKLQVHREPVRIAELTETVYKDFQPLIQNRNLQARLETNPSDAVVLMDRYLYERILFNLLSNAVKFTASGGHVGVRMIWADDRLTLSVTDTGVGIPAEEQKNIFQRFRQVEGSSTRRFEGTGLGLALVQEFAGLLQGTISVQSVVGQGSVFSLLCPAPRASEAVSAAAEAVQSAGAARSRRYAPVSFSIPEDAFSLERSNLPKVLIAEDNNEMASYIETLLHPICRTEIARNGNEALQKIHENPPDLLLTDVMMPERDGLSLCHEVKTNPLTMAIPVVMLTALTHREALIEGWKAGANEYLYKPFHPLELVTRIQTMLKARRDRQEADEKITQLNEKLRRHAVDLTAANKELEAFSYSVSHDLRAPLRAIDGFSRELLERCGPQLDEIGKKDLERVRAGTQKMAQLIDDLLELSQVSRSALRKETVNLSAQADEIIDKLKSTEDARPVEWRVAPNLTAEGDPRLTQIALQNLIQNSWKFTRLQTQPRIEVGMTLRNGKNAFFVRDNGVGFDMAYADKLFKPFQRLHDSRDFPGTGIGLALVQRIIHRHGGKLWAEAEENRGATFYFTLS